ncbi:flagellar protein FlaG [Deferrisoma camini]|uniref:flagellar protein FlaG n=1 Tax=Deferrisoma camini TaxID=1035120 RepID=UPI00046D5717|nr:flagellar protein FlaG [Deferrisoma camini]
MNLQAITEVSIRGSPQSGGAQNEAIHRAQEAVAQRVEEAREEREPSPEEVAQAVEAMNGFLKANNSHIQFALHDKLKQLMVEVVDNRTQEVIKTFPPKELLDLAAKIGEMVGALLDRKG